MKHGFFSKTLTLCLTVALLLAVAAPAMAIENTAVGYTTNPTFTKRFTTEAGVTIPAATFSFTMEPGTPIPGSTTTPNVLAGPQNAAKDKPSIADVTFAVGAAKETSQEYAQATATMDFTGVTFPAPGVYRYVVTEKNTPAQAGVTYDPAPRYLDVYVVDTAGDGKLTIANTILHTDIGIKDNNGGEYVADVKDGIVKNSYVTSDITLSKTVAGNQGDRAKYFQFTVNITGTALATDTKLAVNLDSATKNEITLPDDTKVTNTAELTVGTAYTVYLKHGEFIKILGLPTGTGYTITETLADGEGYTVTNAVTNGTSTTDGKVATVADIGADDDTVAFTNNRAGTVPTGILLDVAPYALLVAFAGVALLMLTRKRKVTQE